MKTLTGKLKSGLRTGALLTSLAFASGCAGLGAVYMQSDDPATRAWGTLMHNEGSHQQRMEEAREGRSEVNVNVNNNSQRTNGDYDTRPYLPLLFTATGGFGTGGKYTGIGKQIYHPGEKIIIVGRKPIFEMGDEVINYSINLTTGDRYPPVKKTVKRGENADQIAKFDVDKIYRYSKTKGYNTIVWVNIWEVDGKEIGRIRIVITDEGMKNSPR